MRNYRTFLLMISKDRWLTAVTRAAIIIMIN